LKSNAGNQALLLWMLGAWFVLNLFQAAFTGLINDEVLYWFHGQRFDFGYLEQAPMASYIIRIGHELFHGELGVRLGTIILSTFTIYLISRLAGVKNYLLYGALVFSVFIVHAGGIIATADVPAIFFVVLFFLTYKHFLRDPSPLNAILWGATMAGIMYSKYNGILVIILTLMSNIRLLKKPSFYLAVCVGILLFLPHLIWLILHEYQTLDFILFERSNKHLNHMLVLRDYILSVLFIFGPLMSVVLIWFTAVRKPRDIFERGLKISALGLLLFFLLYTLRGRVEGNWIAPAIVPMLVLAYRSLENRSKLHKPVYIISLISLALILMTRVFLVHNFVKLPNRIPNFTTLYHWDDWASDIESRAGDCPVVFFSSYQKPARYIFYTKKQAVGLDKYTYHKTQFFYRNDLERDIQGKRVCIVSSHPEQRLPDSICYQGKIYENTCYTFVENFRSYYRVPIELSFQEEDFMPGSVVPVKVRIINPDPDTLRFDKNPAYPSSLVYHFYKDNGFTTENRKAAEITQMVIPESFADTVIYIQIPEKPGRYLFSVSIKTGWFPAAKNARFWKVSVE